jgi:hypothetical protein
MSSHDQVRRLFAPELHVGIRAVTFKLDVLYFHGHVVGQDARLLLKMLFDRLLDRGVRGDFSRPVAVAQDQCHTHQAQQHGSHDDLLGFTHGTARTGPCQN